MNLREKYGQWGLVIGATDGTGKAFAEKLAQGGMDVILVGRREEKLHDLGAKLKEEYDIDYKVVKADMTDERSPDLLFEATDGLDMGFMSYIATYHSFGKIQYTPWEDHQAMININIVNFTKVFHHYMTIFEDQGRGAVINLSSMTAISSSLYNGQYGAGKAYILKMTEAVAGENEDGPIDVMAITLGLTLSQTLLDNLPSGPDSERVIEAGMKPEEVADEAFDNLGKKLSMIAGEHNRKNVHDWKANHTEDEYIQYMGSFYKDQA